MTVNEIARHVVDRLTPRFGQGEAKAMMRIISENLKGWSPVDIAVKSNEEITGFMSGKVDAVLERLLADEPIQYIFGNADFYGLKLKVTQDTLIPRPETAELVDIIVRDNNQKDLRVLDLCTGSGCIAVALARTLPFAEVTATDISDAALAVARENARALHVAVDFRHADLLAGEPRGCSYDIIVSNPPYIAEKERDAMEPNVLEHEPALALFVPDADPLEFYRAIFRLAGDALAPGGRIYLEINPVYASELKSLAVSEGFGSIDLIRDSFGKIRFAVVTR